MITPPEPAHTARALIIVAKEPQPGLVKTRLGASLGLATAAELYRAFSADTLRRAALLPDTLVAVAFWPPESAGYFGGLGVRRGFAQQGADFGARLHHAFVTMAESHDRLVLIGTDSPSLPVAMIEQAFALLDDPACDVALGPCDDGGWYLMGLRQPQPELFRDIPWSTQDVYAATCQRALQAGLKLAALPAWYDIDTQADLQRLQADLTVQPDAEQSATLPLLRELLAPQAVA